MADVQQIGLDQVIRHFEELEDPRSTINRMHPLSSVVVISLMAVLAGANGPTAIAKWAALNDEFLVKALDLPNGVPCKDVFRRVLMTLKPGAFQTCFANWLQSLRARRPRGDRGGPTDFRGGRQDGATEPRSRQRPGCSAFGQRLGQRVRPVAGTGGLRREIERNHGDSRAFAARGHQRRDHHDRCDGDPESDCRQIIEGEADYVLALKGNQETLHQAVIDYIDEQRKNDFADVKARRHETKETGHGRKEIRTYIANAGAGGSVRGATVEGSEVDWHGDVCIAFAMGKKRSRLATTSAVWGWA